jgi:hypothetical protein
MGSAIAGKGILQAPHLPLSARCLAGIRFGFPQVGQFRMMAMAKSLVDLPPRQYFAGQPITATRASPQADFEPHPSMTSSLFNERRG